MALSDKIAICSEASVTIGGAPITSLEDGSAEATAAALAYDRVVNARLSWAWSFNRKLATLARLAGTMPAGSTHTARYALPSDHFITIVPSVNGDPVPAEEGWEVVDGVLHLSADANDLVTLRYHGRVDESAWPPLFRQAVVLALAAELATSVRESAQLAQLQLTRAEAEFARARAASAQQAPAKGLPLGRLAALRRR